MRRQGKIDYLGEDVLGKKGGGRFRMDCHRSTMCHLEGAFPHDLRWFSAYAAKWFGVLSDNEIDIINDFSREICESCQFLPK